MAALVCGSLAYDTIMVFHDRFKNHILPEKVHILNVSFLVPEMRREFGGCAGNIAYNLSLLGGKGLPMGTVGRDFSNYEAWLDRCGIDRRYVKVLDHAFTAQAFITTDLDDNQITAFHPGAMDFSHLNEEPTSDDEITIGIVSPDGRQGMLQNAERFCSGGTPFIFDPGQGTPMFSGQELRQFIEQATWLTVNDYEWEMIRERTGYTVTEVADRVNALIITLGAKGSVIYTGRKRIDIPAAHPRETKDPTGCGDAYRAGILYGLMEGMDWEPTGRIASLMGAIKIEHHGTQNHSFERAEFDRRFAESFGTQSPECA